MNSVVVIGRCGQDPEMKYFDSGKVKTSVSVAVNRWDSKTRTEITDWFNVELWDKQAEVAGEYLKKGTMVAFEGRLSMSKWQTPQGEQRERYLINANSMKLLSSVRLAENVQG